MWTSEQRHQRIIREIENSADRAAGIVAAALLEDMLTECLKRRLKKGDRATSFLSGEGGAVGSFGAKITLGFLLGIYDDRTRQNLTLISKVRNYFAHESKEVKFERGDALKHCNELQSNLPLMLKLGIIRPGEKLPTRGARDHFMYCVREALQIFTFDGQAGTKGNPVVLTPSRDKFVRRPKPPSQVKD
jgi:hypothetical protein